MFLKIQLALEYNIDVVSYVLQMLYIIYELSELWWDHHNFK